MDEPNYSEYQRIAIDFDVFKALTAERVSPSDSPNDVLRRLLKLPPVGPAPSGGRGWVVGTVTVPHGTELRATYKGVTYTAHVDDGALVYNGQRYETPSPAASAITNGAVNGWLFWQCRLPGHSTWVTFNSLRFM